MSHLAIIDLGTNTFHLLVAAVTKDALKILHREKRSVKIGEEGISIGVISKAAEARALSTLMDFRKTMDTFQVTQSTAIATSAFRNAGNGPEFVKKIKDQTGISVSVINGDMEATFIYEGVKQALDIGPINALIMDIGGGSVEFIIGNQHRAPWMESFEIGAQRLIDHFHYHDPIYPQEIEKLEALLDERLVSLVTAMEQHNPRVLIGSSGTFDTLSEIYCLKHGIAREDRPETPLTIAGYLQIHKEIISKTRAERMMIPGMIEMRVDMIVVASCLINYLLNRFSLEQIRVSSYALKEGVLQKAILEARAQLNP